MDLALNNLQRLICHKTKQTNIVCTHTLFYHIQRVAEGLDKYRVQEKYFPCFKLSTLWIAQSAGAAEFTDCFSAEG